jgi:4-alpha-glucanotransferase
VPPDYFSETGQHWGNPLYDWDRMAETGYAWWAARLKRNLEQVDLLRLDHFRGFVAAWHIPAGETTAVNGRWVDGPGRQFFDRLTADLGPLPLIAEDLGLITADVHQLREALGYPGMRVLQFALGGGPDSPHWPHSFERNTVAYTGTHDNDTTNGWYDKLDAAARKQLGDYLGRPTEDAAEDVARLAWASVAALAVAPLQDLLGLGTEARMNVPGVAEGNWRWRFRPEQFQPGVIERLAEWTTVYNRVPPREQS